MKYEELKLLNQDYLEMYTGLAKINDSEGILRLKYGVEPRTRILWELHITNNLAGYGTNLYDYFTVKNEDLILKDANIMSVGGKVLKGSAKQVIFNPQCNQFHTITFYLSNCLLNKICGLQGLVIAEIKREGYKPSNLLEHSRKVVAPLENGLDIVLVTEKDSLDWLEVIREIGGGG